MRFKEVRKLGLIFTMGVILACPSAVFASQTDVNLFSDTKTEVKEFVDNHTAEADNVGLINKEQSRIEDNHSGDGNSSATANSNSGNGINTNVSSTDNVSTNVNFQINGNTITHSENNDSSYKYNAADTGVNAGSTTGAESAASVSEAGGNQTVSQTNETNQNVSSDHNSEADESKSFSDRVAENFKNNAETITIEDEATPLGAYLLEEGYEIVSRTAPTCDSEGSVIYYNPETKETRTEELEQLGHDIEVNTEKGSFLHPGKTVTYCRSCGEIISSTEDNSKEATLPFAGALGTIGAVLVAFLKKK